MRIDLRHKSFLIALGNRIRELRNAKGWSQYELSYKTSIERGSLRRIESGEMNTGVAILPELAKTFEISISELLNFEYKPDSDSESDSVVLK